MPKSGTVSGQFLIKPVSRATLPQEIVKAITDLLMRRVWKPGDMIPSEKDLALKFGVGRSTVREAVKSLVVVGVLEARAGEGSYVREPSSDLLSGAFRWGLLLGERNLDDLVDARTLIEIECARRAAKTITNEQIDILSDTITEMRTHYDDHVKFMNSDTEFHITIANASGNKIIENMGSTIQSIVRIWYQKTYFIPDTLKFTIIEHENIFNAIKSEDPDKAEQAMRYHIKEARKRLRRIISPESDSTNGSDR